MLSWFLVFLMGMILPFAFAPLNIYTFAFLSPAVLVYLWQKSTPKQAFFKGWLFGLGFFGVGVSWVYISIHVFGGASMFVSSLITFAMVAVMGLFPATQGYLLIRVFGKKNPALLYLAAFPATWVIWEWLRSLLLNGFPWLFLGYSQMPTPLSGFAPYFGVYGVSLAVTVICGCLVLISSRNPLRTKIYALIIIGVLLLASWQLGKIHWTKPSGTPVKVSMVQGNIAQSIKWQPGELQRIVQTYMTLTENHWDSQLIIWPEAALPAFPYQIPQQLEQLDQTARQHNSTLLLGILLNDSLKGQYFNGIILLGNSHGEYRKRHLVPFGEYIPLPSLFSFLLNYWHIPMSSFTPGPARQPTLIAAGMKIAPFICYEIAYPGLVLRYTKNRDVMINISDDSWFGKSFASIQQMEMARMRSLETGRFALLLGNTGVTALVDPMGQVVSTITPDQTGVLTDVITAMQGNTPLLSWNYYPLIGILVILLLIAFL